MRRVKASGFRPEWRGFRKMSASGSWSDYMSWYGVPAGAGKKPASDVPAESYMDACPVVTGYPRRRCYEETREEWRVRESQDRIIADMERYNQMWLDRMRSTEVDYGDDAPDGTSVSESAAETRNGAEEAESGELGAPAEPAPDGENLKSVSTETPKAAVSTASAPAEEPASAVEEASDAPESASEVRSEPEPESLKMDVSFEGVSDETDSEKSDGDVTASVSEEVPAAAEKSADSGKPKAKEAAKAKPKAKTAAPKPKKTASKAAKAKPVKKPAAKKASKK